MSGATLDSTDELATFLAERNAALAALDESYVAKTIPQAPARMRLMILHKSRYECKDIAPELRHASRAWLAENNCSRMTNGPLLPEGELPE